MLPPAKLLGACSLRAHSRQLQGLSCVGGAALGCRGHGLAFRQLCRIFFLSTRHNLRRNLPPDEHFAKSQRGALETVPRPADFQPTKVICAVVCLLWHTSQYQYNSAGQHCHVLYGFHFRILMHCSWSSFCEVSKKYVCR